MSRRRPLVILALSVGAGVAVVGACTGDDPSVINVVGTSSGEAGATSSGATTSSSGTSGSTSSSSSSSSSSTSSSGGGPTFCSTARKEISGETTFFCDSFDGDGSNTSYKIGDGGVFDASDTRAKSAPHALYARAVGDTVATRGGFLEWTKMATSPAKQIAVHVKIKPLFPPVTDDGLVEGATELIRVGFEGLSNDWVTFGYSQYSASLGSTTGGIIGNNAGYILRVGPNFEAAVKPPPAKDAWTEVTLTVLPKATGASVTVKMENAGQFSAETFALPGNGNVIIHVGNVTNDGIQTENAHLFDDAWATIDY